MTDDPTLARHLIDETRRAIFDLEGEADLRTLFVGKLRDALTEHGVGCTAELAHDLLLAIAAGIGEASVAYADTVAETLRIELATDTSRSHRRVPVDTRPSIA